MSAAGVQLMAGIEPHSVLEQLDPLLGQTGCIKSSKEVAKIVSLMKGAQLLVVRIVILNIIKATRAPSTLEKFMEVGWPVLNVWLAEAKKTQDVAVLVEVMQVLQRLPVSVAALKQGNMGKLIKQLSKQEHPDVKSLATDLLSKWMAIFKEGQAASKSKPASSTPDVPGDRENDKTPQATKHQDATPTTPTKTEKEKKEKTSKKKEKSKGAPVLPPVEAKPPPGPLVALGRRDKPQKRPRDFPLKGQPPAEKRTRQLSNSEERGKGKGPVESEGFMNALSSQAAKMKEKKRKVSKPKPLSLAPKSGLGGGEGDTGTPTPTSTEPAEPMDTAEHNEETTGDESKKKKKSVSWAEEGSLVNIHYFEMDESERAMTRNHSSFLDAAQREKMREREALESGLMFSRDRLIEMMAWQRPQRNDSVLELVERGVNSEQKKIQAEREEKVLAQLFLSKSSLHPSPAEPDQEPDTGKSEPKHIPLMEPSADSQQQSSPMFASPPHMGPPSITPGSPLQSPATTIHQAQSLINFFNESKNSHPLHPPQLDPHHPLDHQTPNSFHPPPGHPPGPPMPPHFHNNGPGMMPPGNEFYNYNQQGFPPGPGPVHNPDWNGPPGQGAFYGGGGPPIKRGMRGGYRGRGRGFGFGKGPHAEAFSKICKHFVTHGCRLGVKCRFLHCTPSELAEKLSTQQEPQSQSQQQGHQQDTNSASNNQTVPAVVTDNQS